MGVEIHKVKSWNVLRANSVSIPTMREMFEFSDVLKEFYLVENWV